jgi:hypothetical protein
MARSRRALPRPSLAHALDELRFGAQRTLNLRQSLPTAAEAVTRTESWLRQQQMHAAEKSSGEREVLVITGRGNQSEGGTSVVREAVQRLLNALKRKGVVARHREHNAGSFVITLAPVQQLWDAPRRRRTRLSETSTPAEPATLQALDADTRALLRQLAERSLDMLGARDRNRFLESEMLRQFGALSASLPVGADRETRLRAAIRLALEQYDHP